MCKEGFISEVTDNCGMSQPTFYRYFKDKYDMIAWIYAMTVGRNFEKNGVDGYGWRDTLLDGMRYCAENRKYMLNALNHTNGRDSFLCQMVAKNIEFIEHEISKKTGMQEVSEELRAIAKMYCYGISQYLYGWLTEDSPLSYEKVAELMEACIPEALRPYLCE